jgi:UDPglucose--hexose-1-phosphate uridylyltransferase
LIDVERIGVRRATLNLDTDVHRRANPLTGEWVLVSPHRTGRPWQGQIEPVEPVVAPAYDPDCYLCPGNHRASGERNPAYDSTFVFDNDFAALRAQGPERSSQTGGLLRARSESGRCRVVCYSPQHNLSLGALAVPAIRQVIDTWAAETAQLAASRRVRAVTIFENRGRMMGASNPHPHGQIWANQSLTVEMAKEADGQRRYLRRRGRCLLCDYVALELAEQRRVVCENEHFVALVPFWAVWPFETLLLPRAHVAALTELDAGSREALAGLLRELSQRYDALFAVSFPYSMGWHQRPTDASLHPGWHLHAHFYPPLLRSASVRKFMVGYEMLAGPQRDITPESAAERLRCIC